ncbi:putative glycerophosphodiester phosphodiesterase [Rosa chinensis]|uniref:glycerophosphodiester phosphodiesterase n=1 Tax=Rosa chinensis TaxID=74649 RepID=A0A2P6R066_ROSCH|nr:glycerophosphodiester phosphodiesterase GDPD3 isoform X1 [Rosa chinensis]PRQ39827.1 putative glycerophosphodiester phosphodiesterase [Rosa chinensis]
MATTLKAVYVSDVPNVDQVSEINAALALIKAPWSAQGVNDHDEGVETKCGFKWPKFVVMGHRGSGMNMLQSSDDRMKSIKENSIRSFNSAAQFPIDYIEFDVQVTKDDCPVIFHDNFIATELNGVLVEKRVTDITLPEFLSYGPQKELGKAGIPMFRKTKEGTIFEWKVEKDDPLCTLQDVFEKVDHSMGFNIELKFDDQFVYNKKQHQHVLEVVLQVINKYAKDRPIMFSSFQPDIVLLIRKMQSSYPVYFLTNGGSEIYKDVRRNSLEEAIKVCMAGGLQGVVSEARAILRDPNAVTRIKDSNLSLLTYGQLNNVPEKVYMQHLMGVEGVIVDLVGEITEAVSDPNN